MSPNLRSSRRLLCSMLVLPAVTLAWPVLAESWPQWRGPRLDGTSAEEGLPWRWGPDAGVAWKVPLPARGAATPIVNGGRIFLSVSEDPAVSDELWLWSLSRDSGTLLWKRSLGGGNELRHKQHLASPSPVTDGERVWVLTGTGALSAFDYEGRPLWSRNLQQDYGAFGLKWGYASSPLLHAGALYVQVLHGNDTDEPSYVLRIDPASGKTAWRVERPTDAVRESPDAYTTPMPWRRGDLEELVVVGGDVVTGHDLTTGRELWRRVGLNPGHDAAHRLVASPLVAGDTLFAFGKRGPVLAFRAGGPAGPELAWSVRHGTDVPTPVTDGKRLYLVTDRGLAWCHDVATGRVVWGPERLAQGTYSASPVLADGRVYATSEAGVTTVFRAGPAFEIVAENEVEGLTLASPAISERQIFLRTERYLYALGPRP